MAAHPVAANLLMFLIVAGGFVGGSTVIQEVFPDSDLGAVQVTRSCVRGSTQ